MSGARDLDAVRLWGEAFEQVERRYLEGPVPNDPNGKLLSGEGPLKGNPAFGLGAHQEEKLRAEDDLKGGRTVPAAAMPDPVTLRAWGHFAIVVHMFQERRAGESLAFAMADRRAAHRQLPVREEHMILAAASLKDPKSIRSLPEGSEVASPHSTCPGVCGGAEV